jgi:hypothetical protein
VDDKQQVQSLCYAVGLAMGALSAIKAKPYDVNVDHVADVLERLSAIVDETLYVSEEPNNQRGG